MNESTVFVDYEGVLFTITYRMDRLTDDQRSKLAGQIEDEFCTELVETIVVRWDVADESGQAVPITREGIARLPFDLPLFIADTILRHESPPGWQPTLSA